MNPVHYMSEETKWETPDWLFSRLHNHFDFEVDVCATRENNKLPWYFSPEVDGLKNSWSGLRCWMNPPYGREIVRWMQKAHQETRTQGTTVVCLVPARVDTQWWWNYARPHEVVFLKGRLKFGSAENSAPFPSALVVMRKNLSGTTYYWDPASSSDPWR